MLNPPASVTPPSEAAPLDIPPLPKPTAARDDARAVLQYRVMGLLCWLAVVAVVMYNQQDGGNERQFVTLLGLIVSLATGYILSMRFHKRTQESLLELARRLAEHEARWEAVIRSMTEGVVVFDGTGTVQAVNPAVVRLFGRSEEELLHQNAFTNSAWPIAMSESIAFRAVFDGQTVPAQEIHVKTRSGDRVLSTTAAPLPNSKGAVAVFRDVTEMRHAEQELTRVERLRVAGRMAAGIAHDFNNLLMIIVGRAQVMVERPEVREEFFLKRSLDSILQAAADGTKSIERLREFTRPSDSATYEPIDLTKLVEDVVELTRPRWQYEKQSLGEYVELQIWDKPGLYVLGNPNELREVVMNLIFNAIDAMPKGGRLQISLAQSGRYAILAVEDTGSGIEEEHLPLIFDPFFTTKGSLGNGLGLSICQSVVNQHGGQITVRSQPDAGTTFTLRLPVTESRPRPVVTYDPDPSRRQRVVYVDDDPEVAAAILELLLLDRHHVITAGSAAEALQLIEQAHPTVVLTDLAMPEQNGIDLARSVHERWPDLPVGLITGWSEDLTPEQRRAVQGVLTKPITREALQSFLRTLTSEHRYAVRAK